MSIHQTRDNMEEKLTDKDVESYLEQHPDFFENHVQLLVEMKVWHTNTDVAISLIERQVDVLRKKNAKLQKKLDELILIARDNDKLNKQVYQLTLRLMSIDNMEAVFNLLQDSFRKEFSADAISVRLLAQPIDGELVERNEFVKNPEELQKLFGKQLKDSKPACGRAKPEQKRYLFGNVADKINSIALVPLSLGKGVGLLAIGSFDEQRFQPGMGTLFLNQMGQLISTALSRFLHEI